MRTPKTAFLILNTKARRGHRLSYRLIAIFEQAGIVIKRVVYPANDTELRRAFLVAARAEWPLVIIGGGDGTISTAVAYFAGSPKVIGYLPLGTTNNFGRSLGLPPEPLLAAQQLARGSVKKVDTAMANGHPFSNALTLGLAAKATRRTPHRLKRWFGRYAYIFVGLYQFWLGQPFRVDVRIGGQVTRAWTHQLVVLNGIFHGGFNTDPGSSLHDAQLTVQVLGGRSRLSHFIALVRLRFYRRQPVKAKDTLYGKRVMLQTSRPLTYSLDGEHSGKTPVDIVIKPASLKILT